MCDRFHHQLTPFNAERATQWLCRIMLLFRRVIQRCSRVLLRAAWANRLLRLVQTGIAPQVRQASTNASYQNEAAFIGRPFLGGPGVHSQPIVHTARWPSEGQNSPPRPPASLFFPRGPRHLAQRYISVPQVPPFLPDGRENPPNGQRFQNSAGPNKGSVAQTEFTRTPLQEELPGESHEEKTACRR